METNSSSDPAKEYSLALERLKLDRENAERDFLLREKDLALRTKEIEVNAKRASLTNPLFLAVLAAAIGLVGNIVTTILQSRENRLVTAQKNYADLQLEKERSKSDLILEALKTGDTDKAQKNLLFFIKAGFIDDPKGSIQSTALAESPALPSVAGNMSNASPSPGTPLYFQTQDSGVVTYYYNTATVKSFFLSKLSDPDYLYYSACQIAPHDVASACDPNRNWKGIPLGVVGCASIQTCDKERFVVSQSRRQEALSHLKMRNTN